MDPIKEGKEIFSSIADKVKKEKICDLDNLRFFFKELLESTGGLVVVDFLDARGWDKIERFNIDEENGHLYLYWHEFSESDKYREITKMAFPGNIYALFMRFQSLEIVKTKHFPLILVRGYTLSDKEIKTCLSQGAREFQIKSDMSNFSKTAFCKKDDTWEVYTCLNTPLYSLLILPKRSGLNSGDSKAILFEANLSEGLSRLKKARKELEKVNDKDIDLICEKANTVRRVLEYVLKIECCYQFEKIELKQNYSQLKLGNLIKLVKKYHDEPTKLMLNKITTWANELSHDSGFPIEKEKAKALCLLSIAYTRLLKLTISNEPWPKFS